MIADTDADGVEAPKLHVLLAEVLAVAELEAGVVVGATDVEEDLVTVLTDDQSTQVLAEVVVTGTTGIGVVVELQSAHEEAEVVVLEVVMVVVLEEIQSAHCEEELELVVTGAMGVADVVVTQSTQVEE